MSDMTVAKTILQQLGGNKFTMMTGARNFVGSANSLSFRIPRGDRGINFVKVTLDSSDTYSVEFGWVHGTNYTVKAEASDVYCDGLVKLFEAETKLYTRL